MVLTIFVKMKNSKMKEIGKLIRELREKEGYPLRKVAAYLDIDQAILSKIERGQRKISKVQVIKLAEFFNYDKKEMLITYLSDQIICLIQDEDLAKEALKAAEEKIEYKKYQTIDREQIITKMVSVLKSFIKVRKAWIYGSFARGDDDYLSDIDIAVKADQRLNYFDMAEIQYRLEKETNRKIDIGFIDTFKTSVYKNVKPDLKLIYERQQD